MRAFIAIELPEAIKDSLMSIRERLRHSGAKASWVHPENMHLTLRFLGEADQDAVNKISSLLEEAYHACGPLTLAVQGLGGFPNRRKPSVVWAGMEVRSGDLSAIQAHAEHAAQTAGLPPEEKAFHPHITLARIRDHQALGRLPETLEAAQTYYGGEFTASVVSLFSSELRPGGPVYRRLREFSLT
ncbi:MAG TPA: RNA 2',3'-cyclic phosphodiesterase [Candidatus Hydrogenedentes bacterium]|nr:RNA 2',3'-cyclic phosphodiesterase [Candidatus Hydrogenedentota bacterium]